MRSLLCVPYVVLFTLLSGCASLAEKFRISYDLPNAAPHWIVRDPPTMPLNAAESLAVKSAAGLMTLKRAHETAYYEGQDDSYILVRYEQQSMAEEQTSLISVTYRIREGRIYGETVPAYAVQNDRQKEQIALEVAREAVQGRSSSIPAIYNGRMFVVKQNGINSCTVDVVEKDLNREYATYRVKAC